MRFVSVEGQGTGHWIGAEVVKTHSSGIHLPASGRETTELRMLLLSWPFFAAFPTFFFVFASSLPILCPFFCLSVFKFFSVTSSSFLLLLLVLLRLSVSLQRNLIVLATPFSSLAKSISMQVVGFFAVTEEYWNTYSETYICIYSYIKITIPDHVFRKPHDHWRLRLYRQRDRGSAVINMIVVLVYYYYSYYYYFAFRCFQAL